MNIHDFINKFNSDKAFESELKNYSQQIKKGRKVDSILEEHKKSISLLEDKLLLELISNEIHPVKKGIKL